MKITDIKVYYKEGHQFAKVETDEGIYGWGESALNGRQMAIEGAIRQSAPYIIGQDPMRIQHIWNDIFRGTFWRGGPVSQTALSMIDNALWDIKGKALNTPVYNLLGGKTRDKLKVYHFAVGHTPEEVAADAAKQVARGYKVVRICPGDMLSPEGYYDPGNVVRNCAHTMKLVREAVGEENEIIMEVHTRLLPVRAIELCNAIAEYRPFFVEDPTRSDAPEAFRLIRSHTNVPIGTGEKFGAKWDYRTTIDEDLIDYVRTDICTCGGISEMRNIAAYADAHYMQMVPHGVPQVGFLAAMHVDFSTPNFACQEDWITDREKKHDWLDYDVKFEDGYLTMADRPGLGIDVDESVLGTECPQSGFPHWRQPDGSVQDW